MKLRIFFLVALRMSLAPVGGTKAQTMDALTSAAATIAQDEPALPIFGGQRIEPLAPEPSLIGLNPKPSEAHPNGDFRKQNARLYFEEMSEDRKHRKHRVEITLRNGATFERRLMVVETNQFTMRIASTKQQIIVNFSDVSGWQLDPPKEHIALNVLAWYGLGLLSIATLPLTILESFSDRCGC
jgi:hypothetical protein